MNFIVNSSQADVNFVVNVEMMIMNIQFVVVVVVV
jgi:hypothetical protein